VSVADGCRQTYRPDPSRSDSAPAGRHSPAPDDGNPGAYKVILSAPCTSSISLVWINLAAVALGTFKFLFWATVIVLAVFGAFFAGMFKAATRQGRRTW
jgi:hypothetical protein